MLTCPCPAPRCSSCSCLCCGCGATPAGGGRRRAPRPREFWAIKGSWFAIERGRLFCLLGPNGAGKTTTINCLTGGCGRCVDGGVEAKCAGWASMRSCIALLFACLRSTSLLLAPPPTTTTTTHPPTHPHTPPPTHPPTHTPPHPLPLPPGVLPPSGGDALVYGESLGTPGGMDRIRSLMGVCPQVGDRKVLGGGGGGAKRATRTGTQHGSAGIR